MKVKLAREIAGSHACLCMASIQLQHNYSNEFLVYTHRTHVTLTLFFIYFLHVTENRLFLNGQFSLFTHSIIFLIKT